MELGILKSAHETRRSFSKPARRARSEQLVILKRPNRPIRIHLEPPRYRMWTYEQHLRAIEVEVLLGRACKADEAGKSIVASLAQPELWNVRRLVFTSESNGPESGQPTWQCVLENGDAENGRRKDPKYVTHGIHPFKGKFYPQLAKALLNISGTPLGGSILDPFCGSGTVLLEGMLNGFRTFGCDFNPLAAKIAKAKTGILTIDRGVVEHALLTLLDRAKHPSRISAKGDDQFAPALRAEIARWFPEPVIGKLSWLLGQLRLFGEPTLIDFFEVILSSIIRDISQQDPTDLRIRRRKEPLKDAPVFELFSARLSQQYERLVKYWRIAGRQPGPTFAPKVVNGDSRNFSELERLSLARGSVDCVITSPPYATALPYIDTDRLSLLTVLGIPADMRTELEETLTGSREIRRSQKQEFEAMLLDSSALEYLPEPVVKAIRAIYHANRKANVGFRRDNMPALLWRYFTDMQATIRNVATLLRPSGKAYYVVGDSRTNAGGKWVQIETCRHLSQIAESVGLKPRTSISIDVTTENYKHIRNAITKNEILVFEKPS
jgi:SAM-dependent methyltransferase